MYCYYRVLSRATIDLAPKLRENFILLPKMKQLFLFARLTSDHMFAYLSPRKHLLQQSLILEFLVIVTESVYSVCLFLELIK